MKNIYEFVGPLSALVFIRFFRKQKLEKKSTNEFPKDTVEFLIYTARHFMNLINEPKSDEKKNLNAQTFESKINQINLDSASPTKQYTGNCVQNCVFHSMNTQESSHLQCQLDHEINDFQKVQKNMDLLFGIDRNEIIEILPPIK